MTDGRKIISMETIKKIIDQLSKTETKLNDSYAKEFERYEHIREVPLKVKKY